jgi:tRNA threonylcarbamoyladenosine biosynthesis protein TsaB
MLVALDTSTSYASIAVARDDQLVAELTWDVGRHHSRELLDRLAWLLETRGATPGDLTGVAVARGPGSFTGVRVAVTVAKTLAFALSLPVYACSTLDAIAWGHASAGASSTLIPVLEAGRGEVYAARYSTDPPQLGVGPEARSGPLARVAEGLWRTAEPAVVAPETLAGTIQGTALVCGEWRPETRSALETALGARVRFAGSPGGRRAIWLAALARDRRSRGQADDPVALEPLYLRRPAITVSRRQIALNGDLAGASDRDRDAAGEGDARALRG